MQKVAFLLVSNGKVILINPYDKKFSLPKVDTHSFNKDGELVETDEDAVKELCKKYSLYLKDTKRTHIGSGDFSCIRIEAREIKIMEPSCAGWFFPTDVLSSDKIISKREKGILSSLVN